MTQANLAAAGITIRKCAICNGGVEVLSDSDGVVAFIHQKAWQHHDHDVKVTEGVPEGLKCDFCGGTQEPLNWAYKGGQILEQKDGYARDHGGNWGACSRCDDLIRRGDLEGLLDRNDSMDETILSLTPVQVKHGRMALLTLWLKFLDTVTEVIWVGEKRKPTRLNPQLMPKIQAGLQKFWNLPGLKEQITTQRDWDQSMPGFVENTDEVTLFYPQHVPITEAMWERHVEHLTRGIWKADLYWISAQFTQLAIMAGHDFETLTLSATELPSDNGLVIWETSIGEEKTKDGQLPAQIRAVTWTMIPGGIWVAIYVQGDDADRDVDVTEMRQMMGYLLSPNMGTIVAFDDEFDVRGEGFSYFRTLLATLFLINQPGVADIESAQVDKREARRYQRNHDRPQPAVKMVNLRKQPQRGQANKPTGPRGPITWREYRRGHWKSQPYGPQRSRRRNIYISRYIAGPDGAPLRPIKSEVKILK